jgi:hypothetical protein
MKTHRFFVLVLVLVVLLSACGASGPASVARDWYKAVATSDGGTALKLTCRAYREEVQMSSFFMAGLGLFTGFDLQGVKVDMSDLKFTVTSQSSDAATVHVEGEVIMSLLGAPMADYVDEDMELIVEDGAWRVCDGQ